MIPPKSFAQRMVEMAALFALACWLVRTGVCLLQSVWGWIVLLGGLGAAFYVGLRLYKHYKDTHF